MRPLLTLQISEETGMPCTQIPARHVWELVEYLALHRVRVTYSFIYTTDCYVVSFPRTHLESAQKILNEWGTSKRQLVLD